MVGDQVIDKCVFRLNGFVTFSDDHTQILLASLKGKKKERETEEEEEKKERIRRRKNLYAGIHNDSNIILSKNTKPKNRSLSYY